jgi:uncharacterized protein (TIGR02246 family)
MVTRPKPASEHAFKGDETEDDAAGHPPTAALPLRVVAGPLHRGGRSVAHGERIPMSMGLTREELRAFLVRRADAWRARDLEAIMADYAPDIDYIFPAGRYHGTAELRQNNQRYLEAYTDIDVQLTRLIVDGEQGALEWTWSETRVSDGLRRSVDDAIVFVIRDRKIVYWREYFDTAAFRENSRG